MITPVILSGGSGTRLWPLSTPSRPKQFLPLTSERSLFRQTIDRVAGDEAYASPLVVGNARHVELLDAESSGHSAQLILEPVARNTAVAIVMAALVAVEQDPDALLLVMPSDHEIVDGDAFRSAIAAAIPAARDHLVTFGISPTGPETGYGYLEAADCLDGFEGVRRVARFTEKPDRATAERMLASGQYYWNGGIFLFGAKLFLSETAHHAPEVYRAGQSAIAGARREGNHIWPEAAALADCPDISVDYAVMERSSRVVTVPLAAGWSDVGSWDALADFPVPSTALERVTAVDCENCYVRSDGVDISLLGVRDLIVLAVGNRVVIMPKGSSQHIKRLAVSASSE